MKAKNNKLPEKHICYGRELHVTHRRRVLAVHYPHNDLLQSKQESTVKVFIRSLFFLLAFHLAVFRHFTTPFTGCFFLQLSFLSFSLFVYETQIAPQPIAEEKRFCVCYSL